MPKKPVFIPSADYPLWHSAAVRDAGPALWFRIAEIEQPDEIERLADIYGPMRTGSEGWQLWSEAQAALVAIGDCWHRSGLDDHWQLDEADRPIRAINRWLDRLSEEGDVVVRIVDGDVATVARTLIGFLFTQTAVAVTEQHTYRRCRYCHQAFRVTRPDRFCCTRSHSSMYARREAERERERHELDRTGELHGFKKGRLILNAPASEAEDDQPRHNPTERE